MKNPADTLRAILFTLGYTPKTLAADIGVGERKAKTILTDGGRLSFSDFMEICHVIGINPNLAGGLVKPGEMRKGGAA